MNLFSTKNIMSIIFLSIFAFYGCTESKTDQKPIKQTDTVIPGAEVLISEQIDLIKGKRVGIVTNHTAILTNGVHIIDTLINIEGVNIVALFGPEHGIRGDEAAGDDITDGIDDLTGIPIYSLYGEINKPTAKMLKDIDVLIFDIQDIGARFYTYISTLFNIMQAAGEQEKEVIVLDRPNPISGKLVNGPIREESLNSFVGIAPIPVMHGMTVGELAKFFIGEQILGVAKNPVLHVVQMKHWKRSYFFDDTKLPFVKPSPNMPTLETAMVYPGMCLLEGTNVSEGRGTYTPFLIVGAPYIDTTELIQELNVLGHEGLVINGAEFIPESIEGMSPYPKHQGETCYGISLRVADYDTFKPLEFGIKFISTLHKLYPNDFGFRVAWFDKLIGNHTIQQKISNDVDPNQIIKSWETELEAFKQIRKKYLLY